MTTTTPKGDALPYTVEKFNIPGSNPRFSIAGPGYPSGTHGLWVESGTIAQDRCNELNAAFKAGQQSSPSSAVSHQMDEGDRHKNGAGPNGGSVAEDGTSPTMPDAPAHDPYPDNEADGVVFCGKCGHQK